MCLSPCGPEAGMLLPAVSDAPPPPRAHAQGAATDAVHAALDFFGVPDAAYKYEARQPEPPPARARAAARGEAPDRLAGVAA